MGGMASKLNPKALPGQDGVGGAPAPMPNAQRTPLWIYSIQCLLSSILLVAAWFKIQDPNSTLTAIYQYKILSWQASDWLACALPWLEAAAALGLWVRRVRLGAIVLGSALLVLFTAALLSAWIRDLDISCGCFGTGDAGARVRERLLEDVILLAFYLPLWRHHARFNES